MGSVRTESRGRRQSGMAGWGKRGAAGLVVMFAAIAGAEAKVSGLKPGRVFPVVDGSPKAVVKTSAGVEIDFGTLVPVDVTTPEFTAVVDGVDVTATMRKNVVSAGVAVGPGGKAMRVTASMRDDGSARFVEVRGPDGVREKDLMERRGGSKWELEEVGEDDYDEDALAHFGCVQLGADGQVQDAHSNHEGEVAAASGGEVVNKGGGQGMDTGSQWRSPVVARRGASCSRRRAQNTRSLKWQLLSQLSSVQTNLPRPEGLEHRRQMQLSQPFRPLWVWPAWTTKFLGSARGSGWPP